MVGVVGVHLQRQVVGRSHYQAPTLNDVHDPDDLVVVYILNKNKGFLEVPKKFWTANYPTFVMTFHPIAYQ
jgi:hypothetical protein